MNGGIKRIQNFEYKEPKIGTARGVLNSINQSVQADLCEDKILMPTLEDMHRYAHALFNNLEAP